MQPQLASAEVASRLEVAGACQELPSGEQLALDMSARLKRPEHCCKTLLHQGQVILILIWGSMRSVSLARCLGSEQAWDRSQHQNIICSSWWMQGVRNQDVVASWYAEESCIPQGLHHCPIATLCMTLSKAWVRLA